MEIWKDVKDFEGFYEISSFGKIETMKIQIDSEGRYAIWNNGRQLTNVPFKK